MNKVLNNIIHLITKKIDVGKRLDQYISSNTEFSRQRIINLIEGSYVKLNNSIINSKKYSTQLLIGYHRRHNALSSLLKKKN